MPLRSGSGGGSSMAAAPQPLSMRTTHTHSAASTRADVTARLALLPGAKRAGHWPRNTEPSRLSQERPFVGDSTGPVYVSLRGSRPVLFPGSMEKGAGDGTFASGSDPNIRVTGPHTFKHAPTRTPQQWMGDRKEVMQTTTAINYGRKSANRHGPTAGTGGNVAAAQGVSDLPSSLTPLQALAAARGADLLAAAQSLQRKAAAEQAAADRLFESSAKARFERAVRAQNGHMRSNTSKFFLDPQAAALAQASLEAHPQTMREKTRGVNSQAEHVRTGSLAGSSIRAKRTWDNDASLRLVKPADQRALDSFGNTFGRVMTGDAGCAFGKHQSSTAAALDAGLHSTKAAGADGFIPTFLKKVHPSLHSNVRRSVFQNGNDIMDLITPTSKFRQPKFIPQSYAETAQPKAQPNQPPQPAPAQTLVSSEGSGGGPVGM